MEREVAMVRPGASRRSWLDGRALVHEKDKELSQKEARKLGLSVETVGQFERCGVKL